MYTSERGPSRRAVTVYAACVAAVVPLAFVVALPFRSRADTGVAPVALTVRFEGKLANEWEPYLHSISTDVIKRAVAALSAIGPEGVPYLINRGMRSRNSFTRFYSTIDFPLEHVGPQRPLLRLRLQELFDDPNPNVRGAATVLWSKGKFDFDPQ